MLSVINAGACVEFCLTLCIVPHAVLALSLFPGEGVGVIDPPVLKLENILKKWFEQ